MKQFIIIIAILMLSGCTIFGAKYDNNEYESFARLYTISLFAIDHCDAPKNLRNDITDMVKEIEFLHVYTKHLPNNESTHKIVTTLRTSIYGLKNRYSVTGGASVTYCKMKMKMLSEGITRAMEASATKAH